MDNKKLESLIFQVLHDLKLNNFKTLGLENLPIWEEPLIGIAAGNDPYYGFLKEHIGSFHWNPAEVFSLKYENPPEPSRLRVVSMAFPQSLETKMNQRKAKVFPCNKWVVSRGEWEPLMREFSGQLVESLEKSGLRCVSIDLQPEFHREDSPEQGIASVWSHRHTAFIAGLGTFGLSDGIITEKGKAVRLTSLIVEADLEVTKRSYGDYREWCLFYQDGSCGACIKRCPVSAISENGHDKQRCSDYEDEAIAKYWPHELERKNYMFGCGLCQAAIPCESKRP